MHRLRREGEIAVALTGVPQHFSAGLGEHDASENADGPSRGEGGLDAPGRRRSSRHRGKHQRETVVAWERVRANAHRALVWKDAARRRAATSSRAGTEPLFRERTGLVLDKLSGTKTMVVKGAPRRPGRLGTIDSCSC